MGPNAAPASANHTRGLRVVCATAIETRIVAGTVHASAERPAKLTAVPTRKTKGASKLDWDGTDTGMVRGPLYQLRHGHWSL
jgi:hypothetical protein